MYYPVMKKNQLPSLTSTQLVIFDEVHVKKISRPPTTIWMNDYNVLFPRDEEGKVDVERGIEEHDMCFGLGG